MSGAVKKRKDIEKHLQTFIAANGESLKKLMSLAKNKLVATTNKKIGSFSTKKKLEDDLQLAKEEMKEAEKVWNELTGGSVTTTVRSHLHYKMAVFQHLGFNSLTIKLFVTGVRLVQCQ